MNKDVIIACDFPNADTTLAFLEKFGDERPFVKIGMELFYGAGPEIVKKLRERGHRIFLDLKLTIYPILSKRQCAYWQLRTSTWSTSTPEAQRK